MALTRITKGVIKPNENYDTHDINSTGIITATGANITGNLSVGGVLTYEDVSSIDSVGIITANQGIHVGAGLSAVGVGTFSGADIDDFISVGSNIHLGNAGVITATSFVGSGAALTGIDATAIKDSGGNVKIQAQASGAIHSGVSTFQDIDVDGHTNLDNVSIAGVSTFSDTVKVGAGITFDTIGDAEFCGIVTFNNRRGGMAAHFPNNEMLVFGNNYLYGNIRNTGSQLTFDALNTYAFNCWDGNSMEKWMGVSGVGGVITLGGYSMGTGSGNAPRFQIQGSNHLIKMFSSEPNSTTLTERFSLSQSGINFTGLSTHTGNFDLDGDLDVDGHTNLDNVSVAGVSTFTGNADFSAGVDVTGTITATGEIRSQDDIRIQSNYPRFYLTDTDSNDDFSLINNNGSFLIYNDTQGDFRLKIDGTTGMCAMTLRPTADSTYNLGTNTLRWANVYADTYYGDGSNLTGVSSVGGSTGVDFSDDVLVRFGNANDLQLYHNSGTTANYIDSHNGRLYIRGSSNEIKIQSVDGEEGIIVKPNGSVELYNDDIITFNTQNGGVGVYDNDTTTFVELNTSGGIAGYLHGLNNSEMSLLDREGHYFIRGTKDGSTDLYWDNEIKISTQSNGATVQDTTATGAYLTMVTSSGTAGKLYATGDNTLGFLDSQNHYMLKGVKDGAVELYWDNTKKFETYQYGIKTTQNIMIGTHAYWEDNGEANFGDNQDFQLYHNGSHSYIDNKVGHLYLRNHSTNSYSIYGTLKEGQEFGVFKYGTTEWLIRSTVGGSTELWHDGSKKLHTLSVGLQVTGNVYVNDGNTYTVGGNNDGQYFHNGTDTYLQNATGKLRIGNTHSNEIKFFTNNGTRWNVGGTGHIYPDLNNTYDIGTTTYRVRNIYTNDLNLSNEGSTNSVDNTWGDYTIQEGESDLFLINNRNGKKYKFNLTEVS